MTKENMKLLDSPSSYYLKKKKKKKENNNLTKHF